MRQHKLQWLKPQDKKPRCREPKSEHHSHTALCRQQGHQATSVPIEDSKYN